MSLRFCSVVPGAALALASLLASSPVVAQWTHNHRDATNNRFAPTLDSPDNLTVAPSADTGAQNLQTGSAPVLSSTMAFAVARTSGPNRVFIRAFSKSDLSLVWTSPDLDASSDTFSLSSPTFDSSSGALYFATGSTMYRLNAADGSIVWSTTMTPSNTQPGSKYTVTNASPVVAGGRVYIHTYGGFAGPYLSTQVVAFNASTGAVDWATIVGGIGTAAPLFYDDPDLGDPDLVIASTANLLNQGGLRALDAATGTTVWDSATLSTPWSTTNLIWTEVTLDTISDRLFGVTYNFSGTHGQLIRVNPQTGQLEYAVASITADSPPVVAAATDVYLLGGVFGSGELQLRQAFDGALLASVPVSGSLFRNHPTVTQSGDIYISVGGQGTRRWQAPALTLESTTTASTYSGPTVVDDNGDLYVKSGGSMQVFRLGPGATLTRAQASPTSGELLEFNVVFTQPVAPTFTVADVSLTGTLAPNAVIRSVTGNDPNYKVLLEITAPNADGSLGIAIGNGVQNGGGVAFAGAVSPLYQVRNGGVLFAREDYNRDGVVNVGDVTDLANNIANGVSLPQ